MNETGEHQMLWQDREVRFDVEKDLLGRRVGEKIIEKLDPIEDMKGQIGEKGRFQISNLRVMWQSKKKSLINVSIGYRCIEHISSKASQSPFMDGLTETLVIVARYGGVRYEFIFANLVPGKDRRFVTAILLHETYLKTKLYRDLKLKDEKLMHNFELQLLTGERVEERVKGVTSVNPRGEFEGTAYLTNIRFLWLSNLDESFNASIPYAQIRAVDMPQTKYGWVMSIALSPKSGSFVLGFRCDNLQHSVASVRRYIQQNNSSPNYGVEFNEERVAVQRRGSVLEVESAQSAEDVDRPVTCSALASDIDGPDEEATPIQEVSYHRRDSVAGGRPVGSASFSKRLSASLRRSKKRNK